eukprot:790129-Pyramimonas_sp.AAC.1
MCIQWASTHSATVTGLSNGGLSDVSRDPIKAYRGPTGGSFEASGGLSWGSLGPLLGLLGASWGPPGASWGGRLGLSIRALPLGVLLGPS